MHQLGMYCSCLARSCASKIPSPSNWLCGIILIKESSILKTCIFIACTYLAITGSLYLVKFTSDRYLSSSFPSLLRNYLLKIRLHAGTVPSWLMHTNGRLQSFTFTRCQVRLKLHFHKKTKLYEVTPEFDVHFLHFLL